MLIELGEIKSNAPGHDVLMQLAGLVNLTELAIDGLGQPVDAGRSRELQGWLNQIRKRNAGLLTVDWVKLSHAPEPITQQQRREAAELVAAFPLKRGMTLVSSSQRLDGLNPYVPIGVMMPAGVGQPARRVVLWRPATDVLAISRSLGRSALVRLRVTNGTASDAGLALGRGPILLYRDQGPQTTP
jgi:hypothetical protein